MRRANKVLSVFLALALCVQIATPAFAADFKDLQDAINGTNDSTGEAVEMDELSGASVNDSAQAASDSASGDDGSAGDAVEDDADDSTSDDAADEDTNDSAVDDTSGSDSAGDTTDGDTGGDTAEESTGDPAAEDNAGDTAGEETTNDSTSGTDSDDTANSDADADPTSGSASDDASGEDADGASSDSNTDDNTGSDTADESANDTTAEDGASDKVGEETTNDSTSGTDSDDTANVDVDDDDTGGSTTDDASGEDADGDSSDSNTDDNTGGDTAEENTGDPTAEDNAGDTAGEETTNDNPGSNVSDDTANVDVDDDDTSGSTCDDASGEDADGDSSDSNTDDNTGSDTADESANDTTAEDNAGDTAGEETTDDNPGGTNSDDTASGDADADPTGGSTGDDTGSDAVEESTSDNAAEDTAGDTVGEETANDNPGGTGSNDTASGDADDDAAGDPSEGATKADSAGIHSTASNSGKTADGALSNNNAHANGTKFRKSDGKEYFGYAWNEDRQWWGIEAWNDEKGNRRIKLNEDVSGAGSALVKGKNVVLDLNGNSVTGTASYVVGVAGGAALTVADTSEGSGGSIRGEGTTTVINDYGTFHLESGTVHASKGRGISVASGGAATLDDGTSVETEDTSTNGRAVNVSAGGSLTTSGEISGGCIGIYGAGSIDVTGGTVDAGTYGIYASGTNSDIQITGGEVESDGYGIYASGAKNVRVTDGKVTGEEYGVYATNRTNFALSGGEIAGGRYSGVVLGLGSTGTVTGGKISVRDALDPKGNGTNGVYVLGRQTVDSEGNVIAEPYGKTTLEVSGGTITSPNIAISGNGSVHKKEGYSNGGTVINITGGTIEGGGLGIYHPQLGEMDISGGSITGGETGIEIRSGKLRVREGARITGKGDGLTDGPNGSGSTITGAGISVSKHTTDHDIDVEISGGTITGPIGFYQTEVQDKTGKGKITLAITGGEFVSTSGIDAGIIASAASTQKTGFITAGKYTYAVAEDHLGQISERAEGSTLEDWPGPHNVHCVQVETENKELSYWVGYLTAKPRNPVTYLTVGGSGTLVPAYKVGGETAEVLHVVKSTYTLPEGPGDQPIQNNMEELPAVSSWTSADESIATVQDGVVTAVGTGTVRITATLINGETVTFTVYVTAPPAPDEPAPNPDPGPEPDPKPEPEPDPEPEQENDLDTYVMMNLPYSVFYGAAGVESAGEIDALSSATRTKPRAGSLAGGSYHTRADGSEITGVTFPVRVRTPWALANYKEVTDADCCEITVRLFGREVTTAYRGIDALFENESYAYYRLAGEPAYYVDAWYNPSTGGLELGSIHARARTVRGVTVDLKTRGRYAGYELRLSGFALNTAQTDVHGVVLTTAGGARYGLRHVANIWRGTELGFSPEDRYYASLVGQTITQITYYTSEGVYLLPVNVTIPAVEE